MRAVDLVIYTNIKSNFNPMTKRHGKSLPRRNVFVAELKFVFSILKFGTVVSVLWKICGYQEATLNLMYLKSCSPSQVHEQRTRRCARGTVRMLLVLRQAQKNCVFRVLVWNCFTVRFDCQSLLAQFSVWYTLHLFWNDCYYKRFCFIFLCVAWAVRLLCVPRSNSLKQNLPKVKKK